jgi:PAS domain S-box-containing protein
VKVTTKTPPAPSTGVSGSEHRVPALPDLIPDLLDLAHDAFIVTSVATGKVSYWSRAASTIYGWTAKEAAGRPVDELLGTVFPAAFTDIQRQMLETGLWEGELMQSTRTGQTIVVRSRWAARRDSQGKVDALLQINRDITAEKVVHDALARSEFQFRYMVENADEGIVQTSPTGSILFANQRFTDLLGVPYEGIIGRSIFDFTDEAGYHLVQGQPGVGATGTHDTFSPEVTWICADGRKVFTRVSAAAMQDQEGEHIGSLSLIRDIGEKKKAQELLANLSQELEVRVAARTVELASVNQELKAFAYSVSHDLRAPLRGIDGFSQALLEDYSDSLDETGRDYLRRLRASAQRMATLIDDMLTLSRVNRGSAAAAAVDLGVLAGEVLDDLRILEPKRQVTFLTTGDLAASADPRLTRILLTNLIGNAWKFTAGKTPATIELGVDLTGDEKTYFVRDDGVGFDMNYVGKLFRPFQRLHTQAQFPGSGIGLATVQRIVKRHGGSVRAEGEPDHGATFYFTLPAGVASDE